MFGWIFGSKTRKLEHATKHGFGSVRKDFERVGTWIKHLDEKDKQLLDLLNSLKMDISSIKDEVDGLKEALAVIDFETKNKQVFKKTGVGNKQTAVYSVGKSVQTAVQTGNLYDVLNHLSANERLLVFTLLNAGDGLKLSYEDLARLLGKERSTVRGQINAIKQKSEGLLSESTEPNGKKRVYINEEVRNKLLKYAKVRVRGEGKDEENDEKEEESEELDENEVENDENSEK